MENKILTFLVIFLAVFSFRAISQNTEKSKHPLLDKYYPQKSEAQTNTPAPVGSAQQNPVKSVATRPVNTAPIVEAKPVSPPKTDIEPKSEAPAKPVVTTAVSAPIPVTASKGTQSIETQSVAGKPELVPISKAITDTTAANKPVNPAAVSTAQKPLQGRPSAVPLRTTRLGSSSPLYDTYEKNNNGAGSVTTGNK